MWWLGVPALMVLYDWAKLPIDTLYFQKWRRPLTGIANTFRDVVHAGSQCRVADFPGLMLIRLHFERIRDEFEAVHPTLEKRYYHDVSPWFDTNWDYYLYRAKDFPLLHDLIKQIPCVNPETAAFAVSDAPMRLHAHRAESNRLLRYHITIKSGGGCVLYTEKGSHAHEEGEEFLFDHSRYHELVKEGAGTRVVLILDVNRR